MSLLSFCLKSTFFTFQGKYYEQVKGATVRSFISPVIAKLFMEDFKTKGLSSSPNIPRIWLRFVDDTFVIHKVEHTQQFLTHHKFLGPYIKFTTESPDQQGCLPISGTLTAQGPNGTLITMVYRKPTHTDQYLNWNSHHSITNKYSIYNTLSYRAQYVCSNQQLLKLENNTSKQHSTDAIFPPWCSAYSNPNWNSNSGKNNSTQTKTTTPS